MVKIVGQGGAIWAPAEVAAEVLGLPPGQLTGGPYLASCLGVNLGLVVGEAPEVPAPTPITVEGLQQFLANEEMLQGVPDVVVPDYRDIWARWGTTECGVLAGDLGDPDDPGDPGDPGEW